MRLKLAKADEKLAELGCADKDAKIRILLEQLTLLQQRNQQLRGTSRS